MSLLWLSTLCSAQQQCGTYLLENECTTVLGANPTTILRPFPDQFIFDACLADIISEIRMVGGTDLFYQCRRLIVSTLCTIVFPPCREGENATAPDAVQPTCASLLQEVELVCQAAAEAAGVASNNTLGFLNGPGGVAFFSQCAGAAPEQLFGVGDDCIFIDKEKAIAVSTCVPEGVECCAGELVENYQGECTLPCPIYNFSSNRVWSPS